VRLWGHTYVEATSLRPHRVYLAVAMDIAC
jgi:hypothetical protein